MSTTAQKQDVTDPAIVRAFRSKGSGTKRRLIALYLLTVADIRGTWSPKVWNAWKAKLLEDLFHATRGVLATGGGRRRVDPGRSVASAKRRKRSACAHASTRCRMAAEQSPMAVSGHDLFPAAHGQSEIAWHARHLYWRVDWRDGRW